MKNKYVGYLILSIAILLVLIINMFNTALQEIVNTNCLDAGHIACPMQQTVDKQTTLAYILVGIIIAIGVVLMYNKEEKEVVVKTVQEKQKAKKYNIKDLRNEEKEIFAKIQKEKTIFQAELIEQMQMGKAKMTRVLDKLEGKGYIERKRRGMTNIVVLKE